jgi:hypothetical protein
LITGQGRRQKDFESGVAFFPKGGHSRSPIPGDAHAIITNLDILGLVISLNIQLV